MCDRKTAGVQTPPLAVDDPVLKGLMGKVTMQKAQSAADTCYDVGDQPMAEGFTTPGSCGSQGRKATEGFTTPGGDSQRTFATVGLLAVLGGIAAAVLMRRR